MKKDEKSKTFSYEKDKIFQKFSLILNISLKQFFPSFLKEYVAEFQQLETFFERNPLSLEEAQQNAFSQNLDKARNKR